MREARRAPAAFLRAVRSALRAAAGAAIVPAFVGCDAAARNPSYQVRDSAGVRVFESRAPAWSAEDAWRLGPAPALVLAGPPGEPLRDVVGAVRLADGAVAVADAASREVRFYGPDGLVLHRARASDGTPLRFSALTSLGRLRGDTLAAFDPDAGRVHVIGPDGVATREVQLRWEGSVGLDRAASFADGSFAVRTAWRAAEAAGEGVVRAPIHFLRFGSDGALLDTIARATGPAVVALSLGGARTILPPLLGPVTVHAVAGDRLYVGTGETFEIRVHAPDGALEALVRAPAADLSVSLDEVESARAERTAISGGNPLADRLTAQLERSVPAPATRPAYADLLVDALGNLWVGDYPRGGPGRFPPRSSTRWTVFDTEGRLMGEVGSPDGLQLLEVGAGHVLALRWEEDGSQSVVMFGLERRGTGADRRGAAGVLKQ